jgi:flagellar motor component MotA
VNDRNISVTGSNVVGNMNTGNNVRQGNVTANQTATASAKQDLLTELATLRAELREEGRTDLESRVDDLEEETKADEVDTKGGQKAFTRLKTALTGIASVAATVATIEDHVRKLFS